MLAAPARSRLIHEPDAGRQRTARPLGIALSIALVVTGFSGILGNLAHWPRVLAPISGWPAIRLLPSIQWVLLGVAFYVLLRAGRRVALPLVSLVTTISLLCIVGSLGAFALPLGGMTLSTALLHTTISFALLVAAASDSPRDEERAIGVAGFVSVTMVLTVLGATAVGLLDPLENSNVAGASIQTLLCAFAFGVYLLAVLTTSGRLTFEAADWLPTGAGFASLLTVLVLWKALNSRETAQLTALTQQASEAQSRAMSESIRGIARSLARSASRREGATPDQQLSDMNSLKRDFTGLESVTYVPVQQNDSTFVAAGTPELRALWLTRMPQGRILADSTQYWPLDPASERFAIVAPSCPLGENCEGAVVGVVRTKTLFSTALSDTTLGFFHGIGLAEGRPVATRAAAGTLDIAPLTLPMHRFGDVQLQLQTWPTKTTVERMRSKLPFLVLVMGALLSVLLMLITMLGQGARRLATSREKARLASVLERSTDGIWEWDLGNGSADHSSGIWHNLGYETNNKRNTRDAWLELVHPEDADGFRRALARHLNGDAEAFEHEYRIRSASGDWHNIVDRARVVERGASGEPIRLLGVRADVTETRNAHSARLLTERRFRAIFDSGFQFQLLLDREGVVMEVNRVALEAGNATVDQVVGHPVWQTLWWASNSEARTPLQAALKTASAGTAARYEAELNGEGGPKSTLEIAIKPFIDRAGQTSQLLLEARDITVRRRAEAALQEVDTLTTMGRVAARVAHEINNPLAGIQNSFLLIKGAVPPTHPHFAYVGAIEREIDRIAAVTRQLYETYRPEKDSAGGTSVRSLVTDAVSFLTQVNRGTQVRIETDFSNVPSVIQLPSAILRQIFYNLAQNAIEASPPGELVTIRAELNRNEFSLSVRDRGKGVPEELRERIFDPFFSTKDRGVRTSGMGLGLALVQRTVASAGGSIEVADAPGSGAIFTVTLPVPSGAQGDTR